MKKCKSRSGDSVPLVCSQAAGGRGIGNPGWFGETISTSVLLIDRKDDSMTVWAETDRHEADDALEHFGELRDSWTVLANAMRRRWSVSMTRCTERKLMR